MENFLRPVIILFLGKLDCLYASVKMVKSLTKNGIERELREEMGPTAFKVIKIMNPATLPPDIVKGLREFRILWNKLEPKDREILRWTISVLLQKMAAIPDEQGVKIDWYNANPNL